MPPMLNVPADAGYQDRWPMWHGCVDLSTGSGVRRRALTTLRSILLGLTVAVLATPVASADDTRLLDIGAASSDQLQQLARDHEVRIETLERRHSEQLEALEYELDLLRQRLAKIEKARELEDRQRARESFNKRRTLNWPKVNTGMSRREIYRLIGSGTKDRSETERDCRCFSQGRICFNSDDIATKSNIRCQL